MKHILVTGANGQLGKSIQEIAKNFPDFNFDFKSSKHLDITNAIQAQNIFANGKYDYCINCAAYTNVEQAEKTPKIAFKVNADGVKNLALSCKEKNIILVHISTDYVFDGEKEEPYTIEDITNPINEYGKSKLQGEKYIQEILNNYYIIRTSWLFSKRFGKNFYQTILRKIKTEKILYITDKQTGCPTEVEQLADYIFDLLLTEKPSFGLKHFTGGTAMTWYDFALKILQESNFNGKIKLERKNNYVSFVNRPKYSVLK